MRTPSRNTGPPDASEIPHPHETTNRTMKYNTSIGILVLIIAVTAIFASAAGIFTDAGPGSSTHDSIRGTSVQIYGRGIYQHMSAEVAPQGIAQDYVTLLMGIPALLLSYTRARRGSLRARFILAGALGYFLVTYLFYLLMAMYNAFFLAYVLLLSTSFFALVLTVLSFAVEELPEKFRPSTPTAFSGGFLIFNAVSIAFLWLSIVIPPLVDGSVIPVQVEHYTTLVVQGLDLAILLPLAFLSGLLLIRRRPSGFLLAPAYLVFLSILMIALTAKVAAMSSLGFNVIPAIFIIPAFALTSIICSVLLLRSIDPSVGASVS